MQSVMADHVFAASMASQTCFGCGVTAALRGWRRHPFVVGVQLVGRGHEGSLIVACLAPPLCLGAGITSHLSVAMAALRLHIGRGTFVCSWAARMGSWLYHLPPSHPASDVMWSLDLHVPLHVKAGKLLHDWRSLGPSVRIRRFDGPPVRTTAWHLRAAV